jgi:hypothetical protein
MFGKLATKGRKKKQQNVKKNHTHEKIISQT